MTNEKTTIELVSLETEIARVRQLIRDVNAALAGEDDDWTLDALEVDDDDPEYLG